MVVQTVIQMRLKPFRKVYINTLVTRSDLQQLAHSNTASKEGEGRGGEGRGGEGEVGSKSEDISYQSYPPLSA